MKVKAFVLVLVLIVSLLAGCAQPAPAPEPTPQPGTQEPSQGTPNPPDTTPDVTTTASITDKEDVFKKAMSSEGTWLIASLKDLTFTEELSLDGEFKNGKKDDKGNDIVQRKIALYTQDDKRNVTGRFTLTAPKLTINSPNAGLWYGTFKGDIYVNAPNFTLYNATVDGNIYFMTEEAKNTFKLDEAKGTSTITGKQELKK